MSREPSSGSFVQVAGGVNRVSAHLPTFCCVTIASEDYDCDSSRHVIGVQTNVQLLLLRNEIVSIRLTRVKSWRIRFSK